MWEFNKISALEIKHLLDLNFFSFLCDKMVKHCYSEQIQVLKWTLLHKMVLPASGLALSCKISAFLSLESSSSIKKLPNSTLGQESLSFILQAE